MYKLAHMFQSVSHSVSQYSPNSTRLVMSRLDTTRHVRRVEPMNFGCVDLVGSTRSVRLARLARHARFDALDTLVTESLTGSTRRTRTSCCVKTWRDEPSGIWAYINVRQNVDKKLTNLACHT